MDKKVWIIIAVVLVVLSCCCVSVGLGGLFLWKSEAFESGGEEVQLGDTYTSTEGGFSFQTIPGYETEETLGMVSVAPPGEEEFGLILMSNPLEENIDLETRYQQVIEEARENDEGWELTNRRDVTVDGIPGIAVDTSGPYQGMNMMGRMVVVVVSPTQDFLMIGMAPAERWQDELESLFEPTLATVQFFEAQPGDIEEDMEE